MKSLALICCLMLCVGCVAHKPSALAPPDLDPRHASTKPPSAEFIKRMSMAQPLSVSAPPPATATPVCMSCQISWAAPRDNEEPVEGYKLYYGLIPRDYETNFDCGMETNGVVEGLAGWTTYYFAVSAVYANSEDFSAETAFTPALILELRFPNPGTALESSRDLVNWTPRKAEFTNGVWTVTASNGVPMESYRTTQ